MEKRVALNKGVPSDISANSELIQLQQIGKLPGYKSGKIE
jgi:hypothetical protein